MKKFILAALFFSAAFAILLMAQPIPSYMPPPTQTGMGKYVWVVATNNLPKFDLDFPGGTPQQLVDAIQKATGKPLNAVIPDDCRDLKITPFSVKDVDAASLFQALWQASKTEDRYIVLDPRSRSVNKEHGSDVYSCRHQYGFEAEGIPNENSVWYFHDDRIYDSSIAPHSPWETLSSTVCRFYQLEPYLKEGYQVDDITTVIQTAWKTMDITNPPTLSYHEKTQLLIVTGKQQDVDLIEDMLQQLPDKKLDNKSGN